MIRGFGRNTPDVQQGASPSGDKSKPPGSSDGKSTIAASEIEEASISQIAPPIKRFVELQDAGDLKVAEIAELLEDYKRLAITLNALGVKAAQT